MKYELRYYQKEAVEKALERLESGNALLVCPTGSGKSVIIAELCRRVLESDPLARVLVIVHRKELIEQNYEKIRSLLDSVSIYSASVGEKNESGRVVVAGVQSFVKNKHLGKYALVIVDECHLIPVTDQGSYRKILRRLSSAKLVGLTATPYRMKGGAIYQEGNSGKHVFNEITYEIDIGRLIKEGFLSPLKSKMGLAKADLKGLRAGASGDFDQAELESRFNKISIVETSVREIIRFGDFRKSWLVFGSGVEHCKNILAAFRKGGIQDSYLITGETSMRRRARVLKLFTARRIRCVVNCETLTTGFDAPGIDLIAVLRATRSHALWVQMVGRGLRISPNKKNCLILDYGDNSLRLGPIDTITMKSKKDGEAKAVGSPFKECPCCRTPIPIHLRECPECSHIFYVAPKIIKQKPKGSAGWVLSSEVGLTPNSALVQRLELSRHFKFSTGREFLLVRHRCIRHPKAKTDMKLYLTPRKTEKAYPYFKDWWKSYSTMPEKSPPESIEEVFSRAHELRVPKIVKFKVEQGKFFKVTQVLEHYAPEDSKDVLKVDYF